MGASASTTPTPALCTVRWAVERYQLSRSHLYNLMAAHEVESVTIGRSRRIVVASLDDFIERRRAAAAS